VTERGEVSAFGGWRKWRRGLDSAESFEREYGEGDFFESGLRRRNYLMAYGA